MSEQTLRAAWAACIKSWEMHRNGKYGQPRVLFTEHNYRILHAALEKEIAENLTVPSVPAWIAIVTDLLPQLQYDQPVQQPAAPPQPVDPRENIPHQDKFPNINTIERVVYFARNARVPTTLTVALNELITYLTTNRIHGDKNDVLIPEGFDRVGTNRDDGSAIRGRTKSSAKVNHDNDLGDMGKNSPIRGAVSQNPFKDIAGTPLGDALDQLHKLSPRDVGVKMEGQDQNRLVRFRARVAQEAIAQRQRRVPEQQIADYILGEINRFTSSSVR